MPGIVGLITKAPRQRAEPQLRHMLSAIRHQSSYTSGTYIDESMGLYVGWVSHPGSFSDVMPVVNERGEVVLVFSGEEYSNRGITSTLPWRDGGNQPSPAAYLLPLCEADPAFPAALNGRFQGLLIDRRRGHAILFNDRSGMHRLYYHEAQEAFYFAVEAKAILQVRPELRQIDPRGLGEYLTCGCVLENRTLFAGIDVLPPGSAWTFRNGAVDHKATYFHPREWEEQEPLDSDSYYDHLRSVFAQQLPRYFTGATKIGMSVTGGLDTRMVMAWWQAPAKSVPCYSFAGTYRDSHDVRLGRQLAEMWGQSHQRVEVGQAFLSRFPEYAEKTVFFTDGCADVSCSPILYTNQLVREIAPIRMTGNYGGEVLRGSRMFKAEEPLSGLFCNDLEGHVSRARSTYASVVQAHPVTFAVARQAPWHHQGLFALEGTQLTVRSPFLDNDLVRVAYRSPLAARTGAQACLRLIAEGNPALGRIPTDMGAGKDGIFGAVSRAMLEFSFKADYGYNHGMPQWVARLDHLLSPLHLERVFLGRHKYSHFRVWYRDSLSAYVQDILLDSRSLNRWFVNPDEVRRIVSKHVRGTGNYTFEIHKLLTLELLHRSVLDCNRTTQSRTDAEYTNVETPDGSGSSIQLAGGRQYAR